MGKDAIKNGFELFRDTVDALDRYYGDLASGMGMTREQLLPGQPMFCRMNVRTDASLVDVVEDWSKCRSRARAERRRKRGFHQNITHKSVPKRDVFKFGDTLMMHPDILEELKAALTKEANDPVGLRVSAAMRHDQTLVKWPLKMIQDGN